MLRPAEARHAMHSIEDAAPVGPTALRPYGPTLDSAFNGKAHRQGACL